MNKLIYRSYFPVLSFLAALAIIVGSLAFFRSSLQSSTTPVTRPSPVYPTPTTDQTPQPSAQIPIATTSAIPLTVISPLDGFQVSQPAIVVTGKTVANAKVTINKTDLKADTQGNFTSSIKLSEGENDIVVTAADKSGDTAKWEGTVTYTPPEPTKSPSTP